MKLKRRDLNRLIESLLLEVGLGVGMDPTGATMPKGLSREEYKQLEAADPNVVEEVIKILDPTGVTSVPDIPPAHMEFKRDPSLFNAVMLVLAVAATIPVAGKLAKLGSKGLNAVKKALSVAKKILPNNFGKKVDECIKATDEAIEFRKIVAQSDAFIEEDIHSALTLGRSPEEWAELQKAIIGKNLDNKSGYITLYRGQKNNHMNVTTKVTEKDIQNFETGFEKTRKMESDPSVSKEKIEKFKKAHENIFHRVRAEQNHFTDDIEAALKYSVSGSASTKRKGGLGTVYAIRIPRDEANMYYDAVGTMTTMQGINYVIPSSVVINAVKSGDAAGTGAIRYLD